MKQGTKKHVAGELHRLKGKAKEAAGQMTNASDLTAKGKAKSRAGTTQHKARRAAEVLDGPSAVRSIRLIASKTFKSPEKMAARIERWPTLFGDWGKALLSYLIRMTESFFSYLANGIRSASTLGLYKRQSPQAA